MIWMIACVAIYAHSGDMDPIAKSCSGTPITMSDAFIASEQKSFQAYDVEVTRVNPEWHNYCPNVVSSHPIAWVTTLEITLSE